MHLRNSTMHCDSPLYIYTFQKLNEYAPLCSKITFELNNAYSVHFEASFEYTLGFNLTLGGFSVMTL